MSDSILNKEVEQSSSFQKFLNNANLAKEEIELKYSSCLSNKKFKGKTSNIKKEWYATYLRSRIERKIFTRNKFNLFNSICKVVDDTIPKIIEKSFDNFVDIKNFPLDNQSNT